MRQLSCYLRTNAQFSGYNGFIISLSGEHNRSSSPDNGTKASCSRESERLFFLR